MLSRTVVGAALTLIGALLGHASDAGAQGTTRSWNFMPTGNGFGFSVFDRQQNRITNFLDHPYRYLASGDDARTSGIGRRNLAHDLYFGVRAGGSSSWLIKCGSGCTDLSSVEYESQSHIIHGQATAGGVQLDSYAFAPFGLPVNSLLMLIKATNGGGSPADISVFLKPNLHFGTGRIDPGPDGEQLSWVTDHGEETGPGGGHAMYVPIGGVSHASCGADSAMFQAVLGGGAIGDQHSCSGSDQVPLFEQELHLDANGSAWWGVAVLFVDDNPSDARANLFKDHRSVADVLSAWSTFAGTKTAGQLHDDALAEFEAWRRNKAPTQLSDTEKKLWRQSEAVLRMGQIREVAQKNDGMMLAALPIGEWHTGWLRDGTYAVAALSMTGHVAEAEQALRFYLGADGGFFSNPMYLNRNYRVSVCRYFGNGVEEGDFNQDGPNIETDGFGLVLWAARMSLHYSCDLAWLDEHTWRGDTMFEALHAIASDIEATVANDLPGGDASIWEVHWNRRQVFAYTAAAQMRGLFDFADIARAHGDSALGDHFAAIATAMLAKAKVALVHAPTQSFASHLGVSGQDVHVDGSAVGFFDWHLVAPDDPLYIGTLQQFSKLVTGFGGYRRLEPMLSLTGSGGANTYDLSEWILLDIRIADAWRRAGYALSNPGYVMKSEQLISKITAGAAANDFLVPELYEPNVGTYAGVVPMVGYGAGAWMMTQLEKYGAPAPGYDVGFAHCTDPCFGNPCHDPNKSKCTATGMTFACGCDSGFHDQGGACVADAMCTATTCDGHGMCSDMGMISCACDTGYAGDHCDGCASGFQLGTDGACTMIAGTGNPGMNTGPVFNDGPASLCAAVGASSAWDALAMLAIVAAFFGGRAATQRRKQRRRG